MKPMQEREIDLHERIMITHLIKENGRVIGASGFSLDEEKIIHYHAKTVILCTGAGGFKPNGFPVCDLTHDGTIMAYNIGAKVTGKEWNDGHPGRAENSGSSYDTWNGQIEEKPSTTEVQINHHLGVDLNYKAYKQGAPLTMGPGSSGQEVSGGPYVPAEFQEEERRPPGDGESGDERKGPPPGGSQGGLFSFFSNNQSSGPPGMGGEQVGGSSAGMAIHKAEGLVPVDETGLSTIPGLYAAGDALGSYMSGGIYTQIGSSLAGSAVQGAISGEAAAKASQSIESIEIPTVKMQQIEDEILAPLNRTQGYSPAWVTQVLQGVMIPNFVLYIKKETMMRGALAYVQELKEHHTPMLIAKDMHTLRLAHETENMIITAEMKLKASLERTESRCSHYRLDYPDVDYNSWQAWLNIWKSENGEMKFEKQPFGTWPTV
jgi:succinate dehydrogenase/fumarate reductase flavoprotein subunit